MKYICQICGYVYDDAKEKVPFAELPDSWKCPLCGAAKSDFKPEGIQYPALDEANYPAKDYHIVYIGEIVEALKK